MKKDIQDKKDIQLLVDSFYTKVMEDALLGDIFKNPAHFNLETHIPVMVSFWTTVLLGDSSYSGNPMIKHIELDKHHPLEEAHFLRWRALFFTTLDNLFEGEICNAAKDRVLAMEKLMLFKIQASRDNHFIQ